MKNAKPERGSKFQNGSYLEFAEFAQKFKTSFNEAGLTSFLEAQTGQELDANGNLNEHRMTELQPNHQIMVDDPMVLETRELDNLMRVLREQAERSRNNQSNGGTAYQSAMQVIEVKEAENPGKLRQIRQTLEREFERKREFYIKELEKFNKEKNAAYAIFSSSLSQALISTIEPDLKAGNFRKAWKTLTDANSSTAGGINAQRQVLHYLNSMTWDGIDFTSHVNKLNELLNQSATIGANFSDAAKMNFLVGSIEKGTVSDEYKTILQLLEAQEKTYLEVVEAIRKHWQQKVMKKSIEKEDISYANNIAVRKRKEEQAQLKVHGMFKKPTYNKSGNNKGTKQCAKCGKSNHETEKCWRDETCTKCGKKGHIQEVCRQNNSNGGKHVSFIEKMPKQK